MKKITALVLLSFLTAICSRADVIWQELYNYANGSLSNSSALIWQVHSSSGHNDALVNNHREEVSSSSGGNGLAPVRQDDVHRLFAVTAGSPYTNGQQILYVSYIINFTNLPSADGQVFAHFYYGSGSIEGKLWALAGNPSQPADTFTTLPNTFRLGVSAANSTIQSKVFPVDLALNTDYQVVMRWDPVNDDAITLWVNPVSSSDTSVESSDAYSPTAANVSTGYAFRQASGFGGFLTVSNLVVATTYDEAATNVWATNAVAPKIVYQPVGNTNFVGAAVTLSAVANGQGLGSMTYQWQQNGINYTGGNGGASNSLIISSAQVSDSGNFALIATTPYGLSVTSSVVNVSISAAPVPPQFNTQPVSQTTYVGQNVILSTTVSSPGNVSYQWRSNAIAILGANSSTYELDNVQTSYSASYSVAVTNDVAVNGVVSSNAVLTVLAPAHVSIAYLRTLVDPNTFLVTNVPSTIPYQVTGVVTTYTNLTSGNTAGYFLQDATAGINIFATQGQTFRPLQGDVVTFVGVLSSFANATGGLELYSDPIGLPYTSFNIVSSGSPLPAAKVIPFNVTNVFGMAYMATNIDGSLVTLNNVYFGTNSGSVLSTTANQAVIVTNSAGLPFTLEFFDQSLDTAGQTLPSFASSVTGVMIGQAPVFSIAVTKFSDIVTTVVPPSPIPLNITTSAGSLNFNWSDSSFVLQSSTNVSGPYTTIPGANNGYSANTSTGTLFFRLYHP